MTRLLLRGGHVYSAQAPFATAALVVDGRFAWLGDDASASAYAEGAQIVDLAGAMVTPAFVDAHVHITATGLSLTGVDLTGARSARDCLDLVAAAARRQPGQVVLGHGWDETTWVDATLPSAAELEQAADGSAVYLTRIDVHSALCSLSLRAQVPDLASLPGFDVSGPLSRRAHDRVRSVALAMVTSGQRDDAQLAALTHAAHRGIASLHEMGGPVISSADDFAAALALGRRADLPEVVGYWGELHGHEHARDLGAHGAGGDLSIDGAVGSRTACLRHAYSDDASTQGARYIDVDAAQAHLSEATRLGRQAGFHVIGDGAADVAVEALTRVAAEFGADAVRRSRHRLEHAEMLDDDQRATLAELGVVASMQPAFESTWGASGGMYDVRLGTERMRTMNDYAAAASAGIVLAFGSDSPVTPLDPWQGVRAATEHRQLPSRISARAAFAAHTRGARRAAGQEFDQPGVIAVDAPATFAVWAPSPLTVQAPDDRVSAWSTDPRSGTPPLPDVTAGAPDCWLTVRDGVTIFDAGALR